MFHIYDGIHRITNDPVSYNHIVTYLFKCSKIEWLKLSSLPLDEGYKYLQYTFVRAV